MKISGYEHEITPFDTCAEATAAYNMAREDDPDVTSGIVIHMPFSSFWIVRVFKGAEVSYL